MIGFVKKFLILGLFLLGLLSVGNIFYPNLLNKIGKAILDINSLRQLDKAISVNNVGLKDILGEQVISQEQAKTIVQDKLKDASGQLSQQEVVREISNTINKVVSEKVTETQKLSGEQIEELKKELRKQIYEEVCKSWLRE